MEDHNLIKYDLTSEIENLKQGLEHQRSLNSKLEQELQILKEEKSV